MSNVGNYGQNQSKGVKGQNLANQLKQQHMSQMSQSLEANPNLSNVYIVNKQAPKLGNNNQVTTSGQGQSA